MGLIHCMFVTSHTSRVFFAIVDAFCSIGKYCVRKDSKSAIDMFFDYALDKLSPMIISNPQKRGSVLTILYSFSSTDTASHIRCIKQLQMIVSNIPDLIYCLGVLSSLESQMDEMLLDLYIYYSSIGMASRSPKLRSVSVYILSWLLPMSGAPIMDLVLSLLPDLQRISDEESFWEIQAHLLILCVGLLKSYGNSSSTSRKISSSSSAALLSSSAASLDEGFIDDPASKEKDIILDSSLSFIKTLFSPKISTRYLKLIGLVCLAPVVNTSVELASTYIAVLGSLSDDDREVLLTSNGAAAIDIPLSVGNPFVIDTLLTKWDAEYIAGELETLVTSSKMERMLPFHLQILVGTVDSVCQNYQPGGGVDSCLNSFWDKIFHALNRYIYVELCNPQACRFSTYIISQYVLYSEEWKNEILVHQNLQDALKILYEKGTVGCQKNFENMLQQLNDINHDTKRCVQIALDVMEKNSTWYYKVDSLKMLRQSV